jgi:uncharacterized membrane protein (DUF2068 family)
MSAENPYQPPAARVADRRPDTPSIAPRVAAVLALVFAGGMLGLLMLEIASAPATLRLIEHADMLAAALAAALIGLGLWRYSPWGWWIGLLGGGTILVQLALNLKRNGPLAADHELWLSAILVAAFLTVLLLPRTIRAFTRQ